MSRMWPCLSHLRTCPRGLQVEGDSKVRVCRSAGKPCDQEITPTALARLSKKPAWTAKSFRNGRRFA